MRAALAAIIVVALGAGALWWGTDGLQALTAEAVRRRDIAAAPRLLPDAELHDQAGQRLHLADYRGAPVVLEFVYTTCPDICLSLGTAFEQLDKALPETARLLSISFDPADDTERLGWFAGRYAAAPPRWRVAGIAEPASRAALLARAGVVVIPDGYGGFVHNAGLYLVDAEGRLTAVFDLDDLEAVRAAFADHAP